MSQLIGYAAELAKLDYESLSDAIRGSTDADPLLASLTRAGHAVDAKRFHDAVARNLRLGRFLLLAVGDGIHEGVASMSEFLQGQPHLGFSLRLVELAVFEFGGDLQGMLLIQPRVVARTHEVTRAVIRFEGENRIEVTTPPAADAVTSGRSPITEADYYRRLAEEGEATPEEIKFVRSALRQAPAHGLTVEWKQSGPLFKYVDPDRDTFFTLGGFDVWGQFAHTGRFFRRCLEEDIPDAVWETYFAKLVELVPHSRQRTFQFKSGEKGAEVMFEDESEPLTSLSAREPEWWAAIDAAVQAIRSS